MTYPILVKRAPVLLAAMAENMIQNMKYMYCRHANREKITHSLICYIIIYIFVTQRTW